MIIIIWISILWSLLGFVLLLFFAMEGGILDAQGFEFVNPVYIYKNSLVNAFGTILMTFLFSLICPIGTICYWIYKLCTVGRKEDI
jgi:hypothetical protein